MPVPNTFANATATIPLSQLDANFATTITLGNTAIQLGNTVSTLNNMTLANVTVTSGNVTITNVTVTTANVTTANIATAEIANVTVSGTGTFAAGSNTAPSITTSGDTNTGIFFPAADTIAFTEGGVESMRIDSAGNVGIGTSSPSYKLDVAGSVRLQTSSGYNFFFQTSGTTARINYLNDAFSTNISAAYRATDFTWQKSDGSDVLKLDSSGNLGLGVTPSAWGTSKALQIGQAAIWNFGGANNIFVSANYYFNGTNRIRIASGYAGEYLINGSDGNHSWYVSGTSTAGSTVSFTQAMTLDASGNLGLGVTSMTQAVEIKRGSSVAAFIEIAGNNNTPGTSGGVFGQNNDNGVYLWNRSNNFISLGTNNTERARFTSGGHFCVGTTTAANTAFQATFFESANGGIILQNSTNYSAFSCSGNDVYIDVGRGGTAGGFNIRTSSGLDNRFQIGSTGAMTCLGVYNNTVGATNRDVFVDNTGKVGYVASIRASKTNIQDLTDTSWLHQLNPVSFNYRKKDEEGNYTDESDGDIQYGMIAEDVEQVRPDLCFYDEVDGEQELRGIQYSKLVPVMLKEIQKLRAELNALKGKA